MIRLPRLPEGRGRESRANRNGFFRQARLGGASLFKSARAALLGERCLTPRSRVHAPRPRVRRPHASPRLANSIARPAPWAVCARLMRNDLKLRRLNRPIVRSLCSGASIARPPSRLRRTLIVRFRSQRRLAHTSAHAATACDRQAASGSRLNAARPLVGQRQVHRRDPLCHRPSGHRPSSGSGASKPNASRSTRPHANPAQHRSRRSIEGSRA